MSTKGFWKASGSLAGLAVVAFIVIAVNVIIGGCNARVDLTEENLYELSDGTRDILRELEEPVTLKFFFNSSSPEIPVNLKSYAQRVEDLLREYALAAGGDIIVEKYDPEPDSDAEDWARRYGLSGQSLGFMGPTLYLGIVAVSGEQEAALPVLDPRAESTLEYDITRMITRVADPEKTVIGVMSSLEVLGTERPPYAMPGMPEPKQAWFVFQDLKQDYDLRKVETTTESIDDDIGTLVLLHPKELTDPTLYALDQFVLRGGRLIVMLDPLAVAELESQPASPMRFSRNSSNLAKLLEAWGVSYDEGKVVADLEATSRLRVGRGNQVEESPVWLSLHGGMLNDDDILTADLESIMLPYAGSFSVEENEDVEATSLIASSETSDLVDAMTAQFSVEGVRRDFQSGLKRLDMAVRLHGKLKTAFPEGKPETVNDGEDGDTGEAEQEPEDEAAADEPSLLESADTSTVLLIADVDMIYDRFSVQEVNFLGFSAHQPINDNVAFFANAVEQMAGNAALVSVRTRGQTARPFGVVLELQREAQARYLAREQALQAELEQAQQRLSQLQAEKQDQRQRFILSPQQRAEIERFEEKVAETRQELKEVRRNLREDIERLGVKVKVTNILLMPVLVALTGVAFGVYRRMKTKSA